MPADQASTRRPKRGRPSIDWEAAFSFWAALPADRRCYAEVAERFAVSGRTVERHGREEQWQERLRSINAQARVRSEQVLAEARAEQVEKIVRLIDATFIGYADKLRRGEVRLVPADLDRLYRLGLDVASDTEQTAHIDAPVAAARTPRSPEHLREVLDALSESGALAAIDRRLDHVEQSEAN